MNKLKSAEEVHIYDWTAYPSAKEMSVDFLKDVGKKEYDGVKNADIVIILTPQGGGTHTELGMAIAFDKKKYMP